MMKAEAYTFHHAHLSCTPVRLNNKVVMLNRVSAFEAVMHSAPWMVYCSLVRPKNLELLHMY